MVTFNKYFNLQFNTLHNALARCPHCRKVSSVGPEFTRNRGILFLGLGILFLIIGICVTVSTYHIAAVSFFLSCAKIMTIWLVVIFVIFVISQIGRMIIIFVRMFAHESCKKSIIHIKKITNFDKIDVLHLQDHGGIYVAWIGAFLIAIFLFARTLYYCTLSVSTIDGPM